MSINAIFVNHYNLYHSFVANIIGICLNFTQFFIFFKYRENKAIRENSDSISEPLNVNPDETITNSEGDNNNNLITNELEPRNVKVTLKYIKIIYRKLGREIDIHVKSNMSIPQIKTIYLNLIGSGNNIEFYLILEDLKRKPLDDFNTLAYYGIEDSDIIFASIVHKGGGGGFGLCTIEISRNNMRIIEYDPNAPKYRYVGFGLNIQ